MKTTGRVHRFTPSLWIGYLLLGGCSALLAVGTAVYNYGDLGTGNASLLDYLTFFLAVSFPFALGVYLLATPIVTRIVTSPQGLEYHTLAYVVKVHEIVADREIGTPQVLRITSRDPQPPPIDYVKVSGGIFLDMMIHDFDMARYLVGKEVEAVHAAGAVLVDPAIGEAGDVDTAVVTLYFADGALGVIDNSRQAVYGYDQRIEVFGSAGCATADNNYPNTAWVSDGHCVHRDLPLNFFMDRYIASYIAEIVEFIDVVRYDRTPSVTGIDGRVPVVMGLAAKKSYLENRPVRLDELDGGR